MKSRTIAKGIATVLMMSLTCGSLVSCSSAERKDPSDIKVRTKKVEKVKDKDKSKIVDITPTETTPIPEPVITETLPVETTSVNNDTVITIYTYTSEVEVLTEYYESTHPELGYDFNVVCFSDGVANFKQILDSDLKTNTENTPDIFAIDASCVGDYTNGYMAKYVSTYNDVFGYDIYDDMIAADIAPYTYQVGSRESDGLVVGLCYQSTAGVMYYNSEIALDVFGTDDPEKISELVGGCSRKWDKYWQCADKVTQKGYKMISSPDDLYLPMMLDEGMWCIDGEFVLPDGRLQYLDTVKDIYDNAYSNETTVWSEAWASDMNEDQVFSFFGPAWFVNYIMSINGPDNTGVWRATDAPEPFFWSGVWVIPTNKATECSDGKRQAIADYLYWLTLDTSETGAQYQWALGNMGSGIYDGVPSSTVMRNIVSSFDYLGGQDIFPYIVNSNAEAYGKIYTQYDDILASYLQDEARQYANGNKSRDKAIEDFIENAKKYCGIEFSE